MYGAEIVDMGDDLCYLFKNHGDLYIIILVIIMLLFCFIACFVTCTFKSFCVNLLYLL